VRFDVLILENGQPDNRGSTHLMTRRLALLLLPAALLLSSCKPGAERLVGTWNGSLSLAQFANRVPGLAGLSLRIAFTFQKTGDKVTGTVSSPDQSKLTATFDSVTYNDGAVDVKLGGKVPGAFSGKLSADGKQLVGNWVQSGATIPLTLTKQ
jgi:hypothetical protein